MHERPLRKRSGKHGRTDNHMQPYQRHGPLIHCPECGTPLHADPDRGLLKCATGGTFWRQSEGGLLRVPDESTTGADEDADAELQSQPVRKRVFECQRCEARAAVTARMDVDVALGCTRDHPPVTMRERTDDRMHLW